MGVDLVPVVRNFSITHEEADAHSIQDGCIEPGNHRLMRFDFLSHNIGDTDLRVGNPQDHPEWFTASASHGHYHLIDFNEFILLDPAGNEVTRGYKQAFCLEDSLRLSPWARNDPQFTNCNVDQGVSAGWADLYYSGLACQFIVIDDVPDGNYVLRSTTNLRRLFPEDTYDNNTIYTALRITGDTVTVVTNDWSGVNDNWRMIGGFFPIGPLTAVSRNPGQLDLFICGNDGRVYTSWWYNGVDWSGVNDNWRSIGGFFPPAAPLAAVARTSNNLDLFVCGNDGRVYTSWWYNGVDWSGVNDNWRSIGGFFPAGAPLAAVSRTPNNLDVFIRFLRSKIDLPGSAKLIHTERGLGYSLRQDAQ